jgi:hypothetical protein
MFYIGANGVPSTGFAAVKGSSAVFFTNLPTIVFAYSCQQGKRLCFAYLATRTADCVVSFQRDAHPKIFHNCKFRILFIARFRALKQPTHAPTIFFQDCFPYSVASFAKTLFRPQILPVSQNQHLSSFSTRAKNQT